MRNIHDEHSFVEDDWFFVSQGLLNGSRSARSSELCRPALGLNYSSKRQRTEAVFFCCAARSLAHEAFA